jgi:hypothetical protein
MQRFLAFLTLPESSSYEIDERASLFPAMKDYVLTVPKQPERHDESL